ncbi:MAG: hypothetical protein GY864_13615 [Desulfobacterales bacterium]|nr:hypothetical protein [Desulfobacterales bacterium]
MKRHFKLLALLSFVALFLFGCKITLLEFTAPQTADTGGVIILNLKGLGQAATGADATEYGVILQLPETWQVISGKVSLSLAGLSTQNYRLREHGEYPTHYTPESAYKIWVGVCSPAIIRALDQDIICAINVAVGDFESEEGNIQEYHLKAAAGALRNNIWVTDSPQGKFDFAGITDDKYVEPITVTKMESPYEGVTPSWETFEFDHPFFGVVHAPIDGHFYVVQGNNQILELDEELTNTATITIDAASVLTSITYLDGYLWVGDARGSNHVYKVDLSEHTSQAFSVSNFPDGIGTDGVNIYVVDHDLSGILNIVDPAGGERIGVISTMVPDPVGITYDGAHLLVLDESGAIYRVDAETGETGYLFSALDMADDNTYSGPEGISYIAGFIVIGYGEENKILFGEL